MEDGLGFPPRTAAPRDPDEWRKTTWKERNTTFNKRSGTSQI